MSLKDYKKKRDFKKTTEPAGKKKASSNRLVFVVQEHHARQLHYDFRLELEGVLKSWAVPKGPSMNPKNKRLAVMVEDHPFDYKDFEGTIAEGNYGAGEVIVWDKGEYTPVEAGANKSENEKILKRELEKGDLKIILSGKKLKGQFALIKMKSYTKTWLMIKKRDEYSTENDILEKNKSVISKRKIDKNPKINERNKTTAVKRPRKKTIS